MFCHMGTLTDDAYISALVGDQTSELQGSAQHTLNTLPSLKFPESLSLAEPYRADP